MALPEERGFIPDADDAGAIAGWKEEMRREPYRSYLYGYPHKTAYRELTPALPLEQLWRNEPAETLFLYMHIPFCGARCGFCNLFTLPDKSADAHSAYVDALERQAKAWAPFVGGKPFARFAVGGGTPTLLEPAQLDRLFRIAEVTMGLDAGLASISVETSPETATPDRLDVLRARRTDRVSIGVQSFVESEASAIYRPQKPHVAEQALDTLRKYDFPILNLDLIYGLPGQTVATWLYSLERALSWLPEEIFIYPLYTREHTIVKPGDRRMQGDDIRMDCYSAARDRLLDAGYTQYSMRRFAKAKVYQAAGQHAEAAQRDAKSILPYGCQEEGMVGLGSGARSYSRKAHFSTRYGVSRQATESIIADYVNAERHDTAQYGIVLSEREEKRRYVIKAILHREGLDLNAYEARFGSVAESDFAELGVLSAAYWAQRTGDTLRLTAEGLAYSDAIGDWLISAEIRGRMEGFVFA